MGTELMIPNDIEAHVCTTMANSFGMMGITFANANVEICIALF